MGSTVKMASILRAFGSKKLRHEKLMEDWNDCREPVSEGVTFQCKYLGCIPIEKPSSFELTSAAIKQIQAMAKAKGSKSILDVSLWVSPRHIIVQRENKCATNDDDEIECRKLVLQQPKVIGEKHTEVLNMSISRISYCSVDSGADRIVSLVATNVQGGHECHAFITTKAKLAQSIALAISQAFNIAYSQQNLPPTSVEAKHKLCEKENSNKPSPLIDLSGP